ncbi:AMIN domain-containing protein [Gloeocapsopsis dulcis]|uniref:AMIN domain-containing protein n=1 Tax=Gloeocapsopsis dulcis AAB1 = 1H9 TaxID=1433147 RepID=A0A6N8G1K8_9CHRO|nr:AMIN domain-containing protein [Gloeocapsopsis dulcis]MUL38979.1 hypothetical protein [Gloeocapsopsis dulcis AAB1 = 1H9]WNN90251.1 AMIN domain-containing protein [Gloeocapsopsis dulcis]
MNREHLHNGRLVNKLGFIPLMGLATIVAVESGTKPASPTATLSNWRFDPAANQLEITLEAQTTPNYFLLEQPLRIVVDLPNTQLGKVATQQDYSGAVRQVRVSQFDKNVTRIVLELAPDTVLNTGQMVQLQRMTPQPTKGDRWVLRPQIARQTPQPTTQNPALPTTLPPATPPSPQQPIVSVPPLQPSPTTTVPVIEFGQPLPTTVPSPSSTLPQATTPSSSNIVVPAANTLPDATRLSRQSPDVLLLAGTRLNLRYAGESPLPLKAGVPQQVEMVLAEDIRNRNLNAQSVVIDNLIAPAGTAIMGQFETDDRGSRFVAQAIALQGQNLPLAAQSGVIDAVDQTTTTNSPTIEPGKIVQVRLTQDLQRL